MTKHKLFIGSADEELSKMESNDIQLIVTSPPYWNARDYKHSDQIGFKNRYEDYLVKMGEIFDECVRILLPDGKIALNIGNIYNSDRNEKRTYTVNLVLDLWRILNDYDDLRFMGTIYWKKSTSRKSAVLFGSYPYPSNFMISTALEAIHVFRKIGKRIVPKEVKEKSVISKDEFKQFREPIWHLNGVSNKGHPAIFPNELVNRLIKMYSFYGDTVIDPFCGIGTTNIEALKLHRNSIGIDIQEEYINEAIFKIRRIRKEASILVFNEKKNEVKKYEQ